MSSALRELKEGDEVLVFHDPITEKKLEGKALLLTLLIPASSGRDCELWDVEFVSSGFRTQRQILVNLAAKEEAAAEPVKPSKKAPQSTLKREQRTSAERSTTIHDVRLRLVSIDPRLAVVPMMQDVGTKFLASAKPEVKRIGQEMAEETAALFGSLDELGILEPIKAYREGRTWVAVDGRHRLAWAYKKAASKVPLIEVSKAEAMQIIEASVIGRRHWTKGQRAWLGVCQHPEVCDVKPEDSLRQNAARTDSIGAESLTAPALAARVGVSADVVNQAVKLYRALRAPGFPESSPEAIEAAACREKYEHLIWGGAGLGAILAGIAGGQATGEKPKAPTGFHHLDKPLGELVRLSKAFTTWGEEERGKAQRLLTARVKADMTPEFRLALAEALAAADDPAAWA